MHNEPRYRTSGKAAADATEKVAERDFFCSHSDIIDDRIIEYLIDCFYYK